jgi:DNA-binding transcriptional ArsR family regulator
MKIQKYDIMQKHASLCKIMGHTSRLLILDFIEFEEKSVGDIADAIGLSVSTTSQHLRLLKQNNVVQTRRDGQTIYYSLKHPELLQACRLIRKVLLEDMIESGEVAESMETESEILHLP